MASESRTQFSLAEARVNSGHSKRSLAKALGLNYATVVLLEEGRAVHPAKAKILADYFGVRVTDLPGIGVIA